MKSAVSIFIRVLLAASGMAMLEGNAYGQISMPEREHVQAIVWTGEFLTFITAVAIAVLVWRISKRARKNIKPKRDDL